MGMKTTGGEIVQVQGGHILRSTGRKDRHSKVCTAKGPRDRRVRLSAHTAIQFYDVQDRLGYDRPSKAVDWLINKAQSAIDKLDELPPWHPTGTTSTAAPEATDPNAGSSNMVMPEGSEASGYGFQFQSQLGQNPPSNGSSFISQSLDDSMKCFFPTTSETNFHNYSPDIISRTTNQTEDLCLSLQSFRDPSLIHGQSRGDSNHSTPLVDQTLFPGPAPVGFEANPEGWSDHQAPDIGRFPRMVAWSNGGDTQSRGFVFNSPPLPHSPLLGQSLAFSHRGPLQSSFSPSVRAWNDLPIAATDHHKTQAIHQSSISGFSGFHIPARTDGDNEHSVVSNRPSSASNSGR